MKYLLDTNAISDLIKEHPTLTKRTLEHTSSVLCMSVVTVQEIEFGLSHKGQALNVIRTTWLGLLAALEVVNFTEDEARTAALIQAQLKQIGKPMQYPDIQIAGTAITHGLTLITADKGFQNIQGLAQENWRE